MECFCPPLTVWIAFPQLLAAWWQLNLIRNDRYQLIEVSACCSAAWNRSAQSRIEMRGTAQHSTAHAPHHTTPHYNTATELINIKGIKMVYKKSEKIIHILPRNELKLSEFVVSPIVNNSSNRVVNASKSILSPSLV